jgi:hypothetical protein
MTLAFLALAEWACLEAIYEGANKNRIFLHCLLKQIQEWTAVIRLLVLGAIGASFLSCEFAGALIRKSARGAAKVRIFDEELSRARREPGYAEPGSALTLALVASRRFTSARRRSRAWPRAAG